MYVEARLLRFSVVLQVETHYVNKVFISKIILTIPDIPFSSLELIGRISVAIYPVKASSNWLAVQSLLFSKVRHHLSE